MRSENYLGKQITMRKVWGCLATTFLISHFSFLVSCTNIDCPVQNTVFTNYSMLKPDGTPDTLDTDTLWVWTRRADGNDSVLINRLCGSKTSFQLQISHTLSEDTLCTLLMDTIGNVWADTIYVKKENFPHFESVDCQPAYFHTITDVRCTHHGIDSLIINQRQVNYDATQTHFYLYLKDQR